MFVSYNEASKTNRRREFFLQSVFYLATERSAAGGNLAPCPTLKLFAPDRRRANKQAQMRVASGVW
jgi:hypothetical protein